MPCYQLVWKIFNRYRHCLIKHSLTRSRTMKTERPSTSRTTLVEFSTNSTMSGNFENLYFSLPSSSCWSKYCVVLRLINGILILTIHNLLYNHVQSTHADTIQGAHRSGNGQQKILQVQGQKFKVKIKELDFESGKVDILKGKIREN